MRSSARIGDHPIHPMLVLVPAGAFVIALILDLVYIATGAPTWWFATLPVILIGVIGGVVAAIPGIVDYLGVAVRAGARGIGLAHMLLNVLAIVIFAWNAALRWNAPTPPPPNTFFLEFWLTLVGTLLIAISGWLGGSMTYKYRVGVLEPPRAEDGRARAERRGAGPERPDIAAD